MEVVAVGGVVLGFTWWAICAWIMTQYADAKKRHQHLLDEMEKQTEKVKQHLSDEMKRHGAPAEGPLHLIRAPLTTGSISTTSPRNRPCWSW